MERGNESSLAAFLLVNRLEKTDTTPLSVGEFWQLLRSIQEPSALLKASPGELAELTTVPVEIGERLHALLSRGRGAALSLEEFEQSGINAMTPFDDAYPVTLRARLHDAAPPLLFYAGDAGLLSTPGVAIVGSRHVGQEELNVARRAAAGTVKRDMTVISGGARGVDQVAMAAAFEQGGTVVGVLADSLVKSLREPETRRAILDGRALFLTHQSPHSGFNVGATMGRNKIVYALAEVTFVVTAAVESGGTWAGAEEALRRNYGHVAVWMGEGRGPGNELLVDAGATPISDTEDLFTLEPHRPAPTPEEVTDQLRLRL